MNTDTSTNPNQKQPYLGDLEKTAVIDALCKVPPKQRDSLWRDKFFAHIPEASMRTNNQQVVVGPDGFPYFQLYLPVPNAQFQCYTLKHLLGDFVIANGLGIVINPDKPSPDWVFSYGDLLNFHLTHQFYTPSDETSQSATLTLPAGQTMLLGQPSETYLPAPARLNIKKMLSKMGVDDVRLLLLFRPEARSQELVFNLTPDKVGDLARCNACMQRISWFLPRHYVLLSVPEDNPSFRDKFADL